MRREQRETARRDALRRASFDRSVITRALVASSLEQLAFDMELQYVKSLSKQEHERQRKQLELAALEDALGEASATSTPRSWTSTACCRTT